MGVFEAGSVAHPSLVTLRSNRMLSVCNPFKQSGRNKCMKKVRLYNKGFGLNFHAEIKDDEPLSFPYCFSFCKACVTFLIAFLIYRGTSAMPWLGWLGVY